MFFEEHEKRREAECRYKENWYKVELSFQNYRDAECGENGEILTDTVKKRHIHTCEIKGYEKAYTFSKNWVGEGDDSCAARDRGIDAILMGKEDSEGFYKYGVVEEITIND